MTLREKSTSRVVSGVLVAALLPSVLLYGDPPKFSPDDILRREQEIRAEEARATSLRMLVLQRAQELDAIRKEAAASERQKVEERITTLQLQVEQKRWALSQFEVRERNLIPKITESTSSPAQPAYGRRRVRIPEYSGAPTQMKHWQRAREVAKQQFLAFPERSHGAVKSGRALNLFLDICGPTALDHQVYLDELGSTAEILKLRAKVADRTELTERERRLQDEQARRESNARLLDRSDQRVDVRRALLDELRGRRCFSRDDLSQVSVLRGLIGYKLKSRLNDEPLPLDWPDEVKRNPRYASHTEAIEAAKRQALEQLKARHSVSTAVQRTLMTEADALVERCEANAREYFTQRRVALKGGLTPPPEARGRDLIVARRFLQELRGGIARFLAARDYRDVAIVEFPPQSQETASIDEVLAFMCRHGLQFAEADTNGESVYRTLYEQMVKYYVDHYSLQLALEGEERKIKRDEDEVARLMRVQLEKFSDPTATAAQLHVGYSSSEGLNLGVSVPLP